LFFVERHGTRKGRWSKAMAGDEQARRKATNGRFG
jgi:hypothetical protein